MLSDSQHLQLIAELYNSMNSIVLALNYVLNFLCFLLIGTNLLATISMFGNTTLSKNLFLIFGLGLITLLIFSKYFIQQANIYKEKWRIPETKQVSKLLSEE